MRLIGTFETEKEAYSFYSFLLKEGIQNIYELAEEEKTGVKQYRIWVYDENDLETALEWLKRYRQNPIDPKFQGIDLPLSSVPATPDYKEISQSENLKWRSVPSSRFKIRRFSLTVTHLIITTCAILFFWNNFQEAQIFKKGGPLATEIALTLLQQELLFDYPSSYHAIEEMIDTVDLQSYKELKNLPPEANALLAKAESTPSWKGVFDFFMAAKKQGWQAAEAIPMFEKIRQGQVWRFFTPCLMHAGFLHILFNMIWVWILSKQIEERMSKAKLCLMILMIGILSNTIQYLVSGPYFLGFSGVIVGMAGFIWMRQKKAPWEGYPLQKATFLFLFFFILAMLAIEIFTFSLQLFSVIQLVPNIANTAHIVGGVTGILLGRLSFFSRRLS
jgi:GlpG protein